MFTDNSPNTEQRIIAVEAHDIGRSFRNASSSLVDSFFLKRLGKIEIALRSDPSACEELFTLLANRPHDLDCWGWASEVLFEHVSHEQLIEDAEILRPMLRELFFRTLVCNSEIETKNGVSHFIDLYAAVVDKEEADRIKQEVYSRTVSGAFNGYSHLLEVLSRSSLSIRMLQEMRVEIDDDVETDLFVDMFFTKYNLRLGGLSLLCGLTFNAGAFLSADVSMLHKGVLFVASAAFAFALSLYFTGLKVKSLKELGGFEKTPQLEQLCLVLDQYHEGLHEGN